MDIVIVGDGKVGFTLASQLDHEGHNVSPVSYTHLTLPTILLV